MSNNEKNPSMGLPQEKVDILRNIISEARNAGLDDGTIKTLLFRRESQHERVSSLKDWFTFTDICQKCGLGTIMDDDYTNSGKGYEGFSQEMQDAVDSLIREGKPEEEKGYIISDYMRMHSKVRSEATNTIQQDEIATEPEIEIQQQPLSQEKVDILRNVIREARNAGLDDLTIESLIYIGTGETGKIPSMEEWDKFTEISNRYGMSTITPEDFMNSSTRDAVDALFQEGKSENARGERLSAYWNLRMHSNTQPEVSDTMQQDAISTEPEIEATPQPISQENTEKLRLAISEARDAGLDDMTIQSLIFSHDSGKIGSMDDFNKWAQISNKYGISTMMGEDYLNPNKSYTGYSTEMYDAVNGLFQEGKSEDEQGYAISSYRRMHSNTQPETSNTVQQDEILAEMETETTQQPISQDQIDKLRKAIYEARRKGMDEETIKKYIYPFQTVKGWNMKEAQMWSEIGSKYGIPEMMHYEYFLDGNVGFRQELRDAIDSIAQEEMIEEIEIADKNTSSSKTFSLTESGKSAYQHFGKKVAEKLKEVFNAIKSKFLSKDKSQTNELDTSR